jgi:tetratricopeptide (TPR) repeat protein
LKVILTALLLIHVSPFIGIGQLSDGNLLEKAARFRNHYRQNPESAQAVLLHATTLVELKQPFDAIIELEEFLKRVPGSVPVMKVYAALLDLFARDDKRAEEVLLECAKLSPKDHEVWIALGNHYLTKNRSEEAIKFFLQAEKLSPKDLFLLASLAKAYGKLGETQKGNEYIKRVGTAGITRDPQVSIILGDYFLVINSFSEAIKYYSEALSRPGPHSGTALYSRALAYEKVNDYKRAEGDALKSLELEKRKDVHQLLMRIYRVQGNQSGLAKHAEFLTTLTEEEEKRNSVGRQVRELLRVAEPLMREGKFAEAIPHYENLIKILPTFYEAYFALGISYSQTGRMDLAEQAIRKYLGFQPLSVDGNAALGILLFEMKKYTEAREFLEKAVDLDATHEESREYLTRLNEMEKQRPR